MSMPKITLAESVGPLHLPTRGYRTAHCGARLAGMAFVVPPPGGYPSSRACAECLGARRLLFIDGMPVGRVRR